MRVNKIDFVGHPTLLNVDRPGSGLIYSRKVQKSLLKTTKLSPLTMFHLVFALTNVSKEEIDQIYDQIILKLTMGFKYEQLRRGYIRNETELILNLKDEKDKKTAFEINNAVLEKSSLAKTLTNIYHCILDQQSCHFKINNSVFISINGNPMHIETINTPTIRPYHGLLLLNDPEHILMSLPKDSSPLLISLIQTVTPTTNFEQLQSILNCSLSQLYKHAAHLHYWNQARIIQIISTKNFYVLSETATYDKIQELKVEFSNRFSPLDLTSLLNRISIPRHYNSIIQNKDLRHLYLEAITFLLRHCLIVQLHMYLLLIIPESIVQKVDPSQHRQIIISDPANPSLFESELIKQFIKEQHNPQIKNLLTRLVPYMNGKVHLDEITFQENMTRKELKLVLGHYRDEIVTTLHQ